MEDHLQILRLYQLHPDLSRAELAEKIGMSHSALWKRLKKLEALGLIEGRQNVLNQDALGLKVTVIAEVKLSKNTTQVLGEFESAVRKHSKIQSCYAMSGDSDY